jgi:hypothetical protein
MAVGRRSGSETGGHTILAEVCRFQAWMSDDPQRVIVDLMK